MIASAETQSQSTVRPAWAVIVQGNNSPFLEAKTRGPDLAVYLFYVEAFLIVSLNQIYLLRFFIKTTSRLREPRAIAKRLPSEFRANAAI